MLCPTMIFSLTKRGLIADTSYSLPGQYSPTKTLRRVRGSDATETIQIGLAASCDNTVDSNEYRDKYESSRSRRVQGRDVEGEGCHGGRSTVRQDRVLGDSFSSRAQSSRSRSPAKRSHSPDKIRGAIPRSSTADSSLATRRNLNNSHPFEIDVNSARQHNSVSKKAVKVQIQPQHQSQQATVVCPATPLRRHPTTQERHRNELDEDDTSSYYSEDEYGQAHPSYISPLRCRKVVKSSNGAPRSHNARGRSSSPDRRAYNASPETHSPQHRALRRTATTADLSAIEPPRTPRNYSPLSDYLSSQVMPVRKEMVGAKGWLERTTKPTDNTTTTEKEKKEVPAQKKPGFLHSLRKIAKDVTLSAKDITSSASRKSRDKEQKASRLTVSLDPREQSLLYCELEFLLTTALDGYINSQFNAGRLDADKYKRVVDGWQQRGRPKVVGFCYDLETQLDLIMLHSEDFRFYGKRAGLLAAVNGVLDMMRVDARAMRIRTFCQPDTVVAKQLLDAQSLFNLMGCCEQQQIQLAEVIQFFKVILEREQNYRQMETAVQPDQEDAQWRSSGGTETNSHPKIKPQSGKDTTSPRDYGSI